VSREIFHAGLFAIRAIASGKLVDMIPSKNAIYSVGLCPGTEFGSQLSIHVAGSIERVTAAAQEVEMTAHGVLSRTSDQLPDGLNLNRSRFHRLRHLDFSGLFAQGVACRCCR
jgi:hypothetical protein